MVCVYTCIDKLRIGGIECITSTHLYYSLATKFIMGGVLKMACYIWKQVKLLQNKVPKLPIPSENKIAELSPIPA